MTTWIFYACLGIGAGALYAAFAMSVVVAYRGSGVLNLAVGTLAAVPAMTFAELRTSGDLVLPVVILPGRIALGDPLGVLPAGSIALAVGLAVAALVYRLVVLPLRSSPPVTALVATVGVTLALQALLVKRFGNVTLRSPGVLPDDVVEFLGRPYPVDRVWLVGTVAVLALVVVIVYRATRFGLATRAAFLDERGAVLLGLNPGRLGFQNWMFASALAALVGMLASSLGGVSPFNFSLYVIPALGAALAGRLRSVTVTVAVAVGIGAFEAVAVHVVAQRQVPRFFLGGISSLVPFAAIVLALVVAGSRLPNRAMILERAHIAVVRAPVRWRIWIPVIGVAAWLSLSDDARIRFAMLESMLVATLLMSLVVLTGLVGQVSLAQLSFAGLSAFVLSRIDTGLPFPLGPLLAIALTTLIGAAVSVPAVRIRGVQYAVVTLAVAVVVDDLLFRSPTFVGEGGLARVAPPRLLGIDLGIYGSGPFPAHRFGVVMLAATVACALFVVGVRRGAIGRRMLAVRANERAAAASGIDVARTKVLAAAIASFLAGVAGVMFAYKAVSFNGGGLEAQDGLEIVALGYLGGIGSIAGAVIGGALAPSGIVMVGVLGGGSSIDQFFVTGLALVLVAVRFPAGLAGSADALRRWWRTAAARPVGSAAAPPVAVDRTHPTGSADEDQPLELVLEPDDRMWRRR